MKFYRNNKDDSILIMHLNDGRSLHLKNMNDITTFLANSTAASKEFIFDAYNRFTKQNIISIEFLEYPFDYIPNTFCNYCVNLKEIINFPNNIKRIRANFMKYCYSFNSELYLLNVEVIGNNFLNCNNYPNDVTGAGVGIFNSNIIFGDKLKTIEEQFLYEARNFNKPLIFPDSIEDIVFRHFCYNMRSFDTYIKFSSKIITLLKNGNPDSTTLGYYSLKQNPIVKNGIKIKGLT